MEAITDPPISAAEFRLFQVSRMHHDGKSILEVWMFFNCGLYDILRF